MATVTTPGQKAGGAPGGERIATASIAALINDAIVPKPSLRKTFAAMMAREFRVLARNAITTFVRSVMQPFLFVFVFAYVLPKIGGGMMVAGGSGGHGAPGGGVNFATILVPGLMASMLLMQGIMGTTMPLVMEFGYQRTIEDRALAPVPLGLLGIQKILAGAVQSFIGALIVFPIVLLVHAPGQAPHVDVTNWAVFAVVMVFGSTMTSSLGMLLGTLLDPRKMQVLFAVVLLPLTMLGCVYYPWSALSAIKWLQIVTLVNPMVYMAEGLRAVLTPSMHHMPLWAVFLALIGGTLLFGTLGIRTFRNRVVN
ncbi:MAG: ABC transporter permease [Streptosporangiales bacterium]|jgi:ABC-2 type transport system permease protein|nr:ABC transporter permease [Streptosporangiales bacterium]